MSLSIDTQELLLKELKKDETLSRLIMDGGELLTRCMKAMDNCGPPAYADEKTIIKPD